MEVNGQLEGFKSGIIGRIEIGWVSRHKRERMFNIIVGQEVIRAD